MARPPIERKALYGMQAIAAYFQVHRNTIFRWAKDYEFPLRRNPRPFLVLSDLDSWGRPGERMEKGGRNKSKEY